MSTIKARLTSVVMWRDDRTMQHNVVLKGDIGRIKLTDPPEYCWVGPSEVLEDFAHHLKYAFADLYDFCAPRDATKNIEMTFAHACQTADFLKETN